MKAIFIGGPGSTKNYFFEKDYLRNELKAKVNDLFDIGYTDESGLRDLDTGSIRNFLVQPVGTVEAPFKKDQKGRAWKR